MLKRFSITPPIVGRIAIGKIVAKNGKRLPEKDDQFTLTTQVQQHGEWMLHPMNETLRKAGGGKLLACLPLELKLRGKSTTQSFRTPIYYVDLGVRSGSTLEQALMEAKELDARRKAAGFDQAALDAAARLGFANGAFEDSSEERAAVAEEFYPGTATDRSDGENGGTTDTPATLRDKLERKAVLLGGKAA